MEKKISLHYALFFHLKMFLDLFHYSIMVDQLQQS